MVLVVASWASATVVSKHLYLQHLITPFTLVVSRFSLAGFFSLVLFSIGYKRRGGQSLPLVGGWRTYLLGGCFISTFIIGFNLALLYITATLGGLVFFGLTPVIMLVIGHFWLGTKIGRWQIGGIVVALLGITVVSSGGDVKQLLSGSNLLLGLGLMVLAAVGWGAYGLWGKRYSSSLPGASLFATGVNELIGVIPAWVLLFVVEPHNLFNLQPEAWLYILYVAIVPSVLGFALFYTILKDLTVNQAATIQMLSPVFTALLAILFLGEPLTLASVIGGGVLLLGVRLSSSTK